VGAKTQVSKWGNSLAVRIPRALAEQAGVEEGVEVEIAAEEGRLVLKRSRYTLRTLLKRITPANLHGEIAAGAPTGREAW